MLVLVDCDADFMSNSYKMSTRVKSIESPQTVCAVILTLVLSSQQQAADLTVCLEPRACGSEILTCAVKHPEAALIKASIY